MPTYLRALALKVYAYWLYRPTHFVIYNSTEDTVISYMTKTYILYFVYSIYLSKYHTWHDLRISYTHGVYTSFLLFEYLKVESQARNFRKCSSNCQQLCDDVIIACQHTIAVKICLKSCATF